jgi:uncharacterized protein (TIGR02646 family)
MRPVERGVVPLDENGNSVQFKEYADAREYLVARLGDYCSYCEMQFSTPAVEHIQPKSLAAELEKDWNNFLLACPSCNSVKSNKTINASNFHEYFWADCDNTFRAFQYEKDRAPQVADNLTDEKQQIAQNTLELTGLDRERGHPKFSRKDKRCDKRNEAWAKAERAKFNLSRLPIDEMREQIIDTATSTGFWSVWMTVFADDVEMRRRLIDAFCGTSKNCFDENTQSVQRIGGQI